MDKISVHIQSVLYNNKKAALMRSIDSIARAVEVSAMRGRALNYISINYGDASPDHVFSPDEIDYLKKKYENLAEINYTIFNENTGTAKGHNILAKTCNAEYMMIINPDIIVAPNIFIELFRPFQTPELKAGLAEARQVPLEHAKVYNTSTGETSWASTACALFPANVFNEVNGFDADTFFMYCDDVDFSWRIRLLGYKIIYQPSAMIFHSKHISVDGNWVSTPTEQYYSAEASLMMAHKWSNPSLLNELLHIFGTSNDDNLIKAKKTFLERKRNNTLPQPIDALHTVAQFHEGYTYAKHRFTY